MIQRIAIFAGSQPGRQPEQEGFIASERVRCVRSAPDAPTLLDTLLATATDLLADYKEVAS
jgi:hypothetical protein